MLTRQGCTTVVDTASDLDNTLAMRSRIEVAEVLGPRILTAGGPLYPVDGLPAYLADYPKALLDRMAQPEMTVPVARARGGRGHPMTEAGFPSSTATTRPAPTPP